MEACFSYILSTYDDSNFRRRLLAFYLEFDASDDRKMQQEELSNCLEYLGRPELLGKEKILRALKYVGVEIDKRFTFL